MCIRATRIQTPEGPRFVSCRECWQCLSQKVDDWIGRNIAESKTARASHAVTLTYGKNENGESDHPAARVLTYSDVQKYFKRLRSDGFPCRYFAVGEYGSLKGRAHWHVLIYWLDKVPDFKLRENFDAKHWTLGYSFWDEMSPQAVRYACKYIAKDESDPLKHSLVRMSKKPPLGAEYFAQLAQRYVDQGLAPQAPVIHPDEGIPISNGLAYWFGDVRAADADSGVSVPKKFLLRGPSLERFQLEYVSRWRAKHGRDSWPQSELIDGYLDSLVDLEGDKLRERIKELEGLARRAKPGSTKRGPRTLDEWETEYEAYGEKRQAQNDGLTVEQRIEQREAKRKKLNEWYEAEQARLEADRKERARAKYAGQGTHGPEPDLSGEYPFIRPVLGPKPV